MAAAQAEDAEPSTVHAWNVGVRTRLLLAFLGISAFALLAAAAGIYSFGRVGDRLEVIDARVPPALAALELSRSAERIIAAAPALLAAADRAQRDEVKAGLEAEVARLNDKLGELRNETDKALPLSEIEPLVGSLIANLSGLEALVARRLDANERVRNLQREVFRTNDETARLLSPWTEMLEGQIARGGQDSEATHRLATALAQLRPIQTAQSRFSAAADMLAEASTTDQDRRLSVLAFQLQRALRELDATAADLAPKLRPLFGAQIARLRTFAEGPQAIATARRQELALIGEGRKLLSENARLSARLAGAVDRLAAAAKADIGDSTRAALSVQRLGTRLLVLLVALSLLTSALIVWLYVGRNIVRRLTRLSDGMLAIAAGRLDAPVAAGGGDEIAAMGRAVEVFRRNAVELGRLLDERKQTAARLEEVVEERTRELERRSAVLRVTFENMGHGVVMFDRDRRMVAWNRQFQELLELPDDRVGHEILFEDFIRFMAERGEYGVCDVDALVVRHLSSIDRSFVDERTRPNGTVLDIRRNPIPSGGFVSIYTDVTQERRAQALVEQARARLTDAIESLSDGFALWDKDDRLVVFNSRCEALLNAADLFVVGTRFEDLIRAFHRTGRYAHAEAGHFESWVAERLALHRNTPSVCELRLASGVWLQVREFRTHEGGTVTIWTDISPVKQRELELESARDSAAAARRTAEQAYAELKATQASLVHAEKMASLGELTAGIAHEIKNPLNFVNNFAGLSMELLDELREALAAARSSLDSAGRAELDQTMTLLSTNLDKIRSHGQRADGIVRSMLLHSRGGSGERQTVDINAVLEEALNLAYHGARAQDPEFNVTLVRDLQPDTKPIEIVPQDMTRVFLNLIGNGFYAMTRRRRQEGEAFRPTLKVATRDGPEGIEITIRDNGTGIAPQHRERLFQPFFTTKPTGEGTGLGLSISYDIVTQQHGGTIAVDSEPGRFTEFRIGLPRRAAVHAAAH